MRRHYRSAGLAEGDLADDPFQQFERWFTEAGAAGIPEPNAMVLSTADAEGRPSSRTVLLKGWSGTGFVFYTNYGSRKATELTVNPQAALLFPWHPIARQVIVCGTVTRTGSTENEEYFASRPHGSRLGAWASEQSAPLAEREELEARYRALAARYPEQTPVPVPPHWGGFRVAPETVEFWQGREDRLHDRLLYRRTEDGSWSVGRLNP
jgi:pyridoxamine 5'-phosphate oxidase